MAVTPVHHVSAAGVVRSEAGEVLLIRSPLRGWEFPGGMVESRESVQDALKREIWEESGVRVEITGFAGLCKNVELDIVNLEFCCRYLGGELRGSSESLEVRWFSREEALETVEFPLAKCWLEYILGGGKQVRCFSFRKDPFTILEDTLLPAGE